MKYVTICLQHCKENTPTLGKGQTAVVEEASRANCNSFKTQHLLEQVQHVNFCLQITVSECKFNLAINFTLSFS